MHKITSESPFYGMSARDFLKKKYEIVVILEGVIEQTGNTIQVRGVDCPPSLPGTLLIPAKRDPLGISLCKPAQLQAFRGRVQNRLLCFQFSLQVRIKPNININHLLRVEMSNQSQETEDKSEDKEDDDEDKPDSVSPSIRRQAPPCSPAIQPSLYPSLERSPRLSMHPAVARLLPNAVRENRAKSCVEMQHVV